MMNKFFPQTPSSIQTYVTCPVQFKEKYITKSVVFKANKYTAFGETVHRSIELYLKGEDALPSTLIPMKPLLDKMKIVLLGAEVKLAVNTDGGPVNFYDKRAYQRCIVDAMLSDKDNSVIVCVDWKTGKKSCTQIQQDVIKKCTRALYPNATIVTQFVYLFKGGYETQVYTGNQSLPMLDTAMSALLDSLSSNDFRPKPNPLCKRWCEVTTCKFNGAFKN